MKRGKVFLSIFHILSRDLRCIKHHVLEETDLNISLFCSGRAKTTTTTDKKLERFVKIDRIKPEKDTVDNLK